MLAPPKTSPIPGTVPYTNPVTPSLLDLFKNNSSNKFPWSKLTWIDSVQTYCYFNFHVFHKIRQTFALETNLHQFFSWSLTSWKLFCEKLQDDLFAKVKRLQNRVLSYGMYKDIPLLEWLQ